MRLLVYTHMCIYNTYTYILLSFFVYNRWGFRHLFIECRLVLNSENNPWNCVPNTAPFHLFVTLSFLCQTNASLIPAKFKSYWLGCKRKVRLNTRKNGALLILVSSQPIINTVLFNVYFQKTLPWKLFCPMAFLFALYWVIFL